MNKLFVGLVLTFLSGVVLCQPDEDKQPMAVKFLRHYGYLPASRRNGSGDVPAAIRKFQEFFGLKVNGLLNAETMKLMKKSRCGNPDPSGGRRRQRRYATWWKKWSKNDLTYYVQPGADLPADQQKEIFAKALKFWSEVSRLTFTEVNSASSADIKVSFGSYQHHGTNAESTCPYDFDGPGSVLAHAYYPTDGRAHFDESETYTHNSYSGINLLWVAVHEFGHALGLQHTNVEGAVMYPYYTGYTPNMQLHSDDIAGIQSLYECQANALGMESGAISDSQISASSAHPIAADHAAHQGRLNFQETSVKAGAWTAATDDVNQWLQVDMGNQLTKVSRVATQGRDYSSQWPWGPHSQWVTKYKLQYSDDGVNFQYYGEQGQSADKEFDGNTDQNTVVYHDLLPIVTARYFRFRPTAWHGHISMRVELYGC